MLADKLVAHRGYQKPYPENTLLSFSKAIEAGARLIECDIQFSADGEPIVYHDISMMRVSDQENAIHLLPAEDIIKIPAFEPARLSNLYREERIIPLTALVDLVAAHPELTLFVELKRAGLHFIGSERALAALEQVLAPVKKQCVLISFNHEFILQARQQGWPQVGIVVETWQEQYSETAKEIKPDYVFCSLDSIPPDASLDRENTNIVVYEIDDPELAIHWFDRGADMIETFDIGHLLEALAHKAL